MSNVAKNSLQILKSKVKQLNKTGRRYTCVMSTKLEYTEHGEPCKVVKRRDEKIEAVKPNEILVKMLAAPVNPVDINIIEGRYPTRPRLPSVPGNEGVGEVVNFGSEISNLQLGDHVVVVKSNLGTWRTYAVYTQESVLKVPRNLGLLEAATLTVNPCTAYRMLKDFVTLKPGHTVIQNGANSACGQAIIQICKAWDLKTINIIRDRKNVVDLQQVLFGLGATHVLSEEQFSKTSLFKNDEEVKPRLALNCIGGKSATQILRLLQPSCPMVTYGGMSRQPVSVPTTSLIFKDIYLRGFWVSKWKDNNFKNPQWQLMFDELVSLMMDNLLRAPAVKVINFEHFREALENTLTVHGKVGKKYILDFDNNIC